MRFPHDSRILRPLLYTAASAVAMLAAAPAFAGPMLQNYNVDFSSPTQAIWGPGQSAADFAFNQMILGNTTFGMRFQTGASTGTVRSNYNGNVSVAYDDLAAPGLVPLSIGYQGDASGGHFQTALGAFVNVTAYFPVIGGVTLTNPNYSLNTARTYTPSPPDTLSDNDAFTPTSSVIGPALPGGSAQAGIDYDIVQNAKHEVSALKGLAVATNQTSGAVRSTSFFLDALDAISLNLDEEGVWDIKLTSLALDNLFSTDFDLAFVPFIEYTLGFGCGDAGTDSDNGFFCAEDGRLDRTLASIDLFSNTPFALALTSSSVLSTFQITVTDEQIIAAPEPGTLALFGIGAAGLLAMRRRRTR
jgi:hypothetical protein